MDRLIKDNIKKRGLLLGFLFCSQIAMARNSCVVPLELVNVRSSAAPEYKLGIYVGLGGGSPQFYELDTGGAGFWAAYNAAPPKKKGQWWGSYEMVQPDSLNITYTSGNQYTANLVKTEVALYKRERFKYSKVCGSSEPLGVAQISSYKNQLKPSAQKDWYNALAKGKAPLFGRFYGDFGAALFPVMTSDESNGIYSILPQLPQDNLTNGFIIHVGPLNKAKPTLTIGITDEDRSKFKTQLPMNQACQKTPGDVTAPVAGCMPYPPFPISNMPTWSEQITNANLSWGYKSLHTVEGQAFENIGLTIDTGAPSTTLWQNNQLFVNPQFLNQPKGTAIPYVGNLKSKVIFSMRAPTIVGDGEDLDFNLVTGQKSTINQISASVRKNDGGPTWSGYMNTGLMLFTHYDVMFDVENGLVGFRAIK